MSDIEGQTQEAPLSDSQAISEATDRAFEKLSADAETQKADAKPVEAKSDVKDGDDKPVITNESNDKKADIMIPKHRFDEVNAKAKAYESFGTPEELQEKLAKLQELTKPKPSTEVKTAEQRIEDLNDEDKEVQKYLGKIAPEINQLPEVIKMVKEMQAERKAEREYLEKQVQAEKEQERAVLAKHNEKAMEVIKDLAKSAGLNVEDEVNMKLVANMIADMVHADKELTNKYYGEKNLDILKDVFKDFQKRFFSGVQRKAAAEILGGKKQQNNLPKPPVDGGSPQKTPSDDVTKMTLDQVGDLAYDRVMGR